MPTRLGANRREGTLETRPEGRRPPKVLSGETKDTRVRQARSSLRWCHLQSSFKAAKAPPKTGPVRDAPLREGRSQVLRLAARSTSGRPAHVPSLELRADLPGRLGARARAL